MKNHIILLLILFTTTFSAWSQAPDKMSFQAVVRNANNQLVTSSTVGVQITIALGTFPIYTERQQVSTNENGLLSLIIGNGTVTYGSLSEIGWNLGSYNLSCQIDPTGGTNYTIQSISQLLSVPFALNAKHCDYNNLTNKPTVDGSETKLSAGANTTVTGTGTTADPYVINAPSGGSSHKIGDLYGGGIIFSLWNENGVEHGLIASLTTLGFSIYSNVSTAVVDANGNDAATSPHNGLANTTAIVAQSGHISSAAKLCSDYTYNGFDDWYLPSIFELRQLYNAAASLNYVLGATDGFNIVSYWSSTEDIGSGSMYLSFKLGQCITGQKSITCRVRAVRKF
jgi:hypothetical protein